MPATSPRFGPEDLAPPFASTPLPPAVLQPRRKDREKEEEDAFEVKPASFLSNERTFLSWCSFVRLSSGYVGVTG